MTVAVIVVLLVAFNLYIPLTYSLTWTENGGGAGGGGNDSVAASAECTSSTDLVYFDIYIYPWFDLVLTSLLPSALLVLGNSALSLTLFRSLSQVRRMTTNTTTPTTTTPISTITTTTTTSTTSHHAAGPAEFQPPPRGTAKREKAASSLTLTLVSISITFLGLTLPICVYAIVNEYVVVADARHEAWLELVMVVCNLLWYCNSAVNFYLYCLTGSKFRAQCKHLLLCGACRRGAARRGGAGGGAACAELLPSSTPRPRQPQ